MSKDKPKHEFTNAKGEDITGLAGLAKREQVEDIMDFVDPGEYVKESDTGEIIRFGDMLEDWSNGFLKSPDFYSYCKSISIEVKESNEIIEGLRQSEEDAQRLFNKLRKHIKELETELSDLKYKEKYH